jgi:hypothetical protein
VNVYPFIEAEKAQQHKVTRACQLMEVSRSAYYAHREGPSSRAAQDVELTEQIIAVHEASAGTYGTPRIHAELQRRGRRHFRGVRAGGPTRNAARCRPLNTPGTDPARIGRFGKADPAQLVLSRRGEAQL